MEYFVLGNLIDRKQNGYDLVIGGFVKRAAG